MLHRNLHAQQALGKYLLFPLPSPFSHHSGENDSNNKEKLTPSFYSVDAPRFCVSPPLADNLPDSTQPQPQAPLNLSEPGEVFLEDGIAVRPPPPSLPD